jgi:AraC-like DNA-binding protein
MPDPPYALQRILAGWSFSERIQTYRRAHIHLSGRVHVFNILFQPTGLNRLAGINMVSLVNQDPAASDVLGKSAVALGDAVRAAPDFYLRVAAVERWVGMMLDKRGTDGTIDHASRLMIAVQGRMRIEYFVTSSGLSASQFQRRFAAQVGMTPKLFARTIRFDRALVARRNAPNRLWTDIIHALGYFDQAHFIRECRAFASLPPSGLVGDWNNIFFRWMTKIYKRVRKLCRKVCPSGNEHDAAQIWYHHSQHRCCRGRRKDRSDGYVHESGTFQGDR